MQLTDQYKALNPMQQVPAVEIDGITLSQSVSACRLYTFIAIYSIKMFTSVLVKGMLYRFLS